MSLSFKVLSREGLARQGVLTTDCGIIQTPAFMPVGTKGTVKGLLPSQVSKTGAEIILGNTYHLMIRPGSNRVREFGGLHKFMGWEGPILTDSGGFQVLSLASLRKIDQYGVTFRAHTDGSIHRLTPESCINLQKDFNSDISMVLDECTSYPIDKQKAASSMHLSMEWAKRSRDAFKDRPGKGVFGIIQGSIFQELRLESLESIHNLNFDGIAIGGLAVGEGQDVMLDVLHGISKELPVELPHYLMGVGTPDDIVKAVSMGIDMFDCVLPTRSGRTGRVYTKDGHINIKNALHQNDLGPIDKECYCDTCQKFSKSYINHLFRCKEMLGPILCSIHNLFFYQTLMCDIRKAIKTGSYEKFTERWKKRWQGQSVT